MRREDWQFRFSEFIQDRSGMPFSWGRNDCCIFAAESVKALTGVNPMESFEAYGTEPGPRRKALGRTLRRLEQSGGLKGIACQFLGTPLPPLMAGVGDVVLLEIDGREALGVCNGINALGPGPDGMRALEMKAALAAWKI